MPLAPSIAPASPPGAKSSEARTDRDTFIALVDGHYSDPVRIMVFNTAEGWSRGVTEELAEEIARRWAMDGFDVPPSLEGFVDRHDGEKPHFRLRRRIQ